MLSLLLGQNKNIVCLPKRDRPKKNPAESNSFFCCKISNLFFISGFSTYKILALQVKSLSRLQHYEILAGKRLSDTDEIFFRYPQHLSLYIETTSGFEISGRPLAICE